MRASILFTYYESQWLNRVQSASPSLQRHRGVFLRRIFWIPYIRPRIWWITRRQDYSLSNAGVSLSYLSCPAWWTKCISHEQCTLKTNMKHVLDKWEGEDLTEGWKVFVGGSLWQLEAVVWSVRHCEVIWGWNCRASGQKQCKMWVPRSHSLWSLWNCPSRPTGKRHTWQRSSPNPEGHGTNGDEWLCRAVSQVASAVADSGCDTDNLNCFFRRGKGRGHISVSCCQPWPWQQSLCVGFVASWFNIWARSLQGSDCLLPSFFSFLL